jgi:hypothetical protein
MMPYPRERYWSECRTKYWMCLLVVLLMGNRDQSNQSRVVMAKPNRLQYLYWYEPTNRNDDGMANNSTENQDVELIVYEYTGPMSRGDFFQSTHPRVVQFYNPFCVRTYMNFAHGLAWLLLLLLLRLLLKTSLFLLLSKKQYTI